MANNDNQFWANFMQQMQQNPNFFQQVQQNPSFPQQNPSFPQQNPNFAAAGFAPFATSSSLVFGGGSSSPATPSPQNLQFAGSQAAINLGDEYEFQSEQAEFQPEQPRPSKSKSKAKAKSQSQGEKKESLVNYNMAETMWLARCWSDISNDPITNNRQKDEAYWKRIAQRYNEGRPEDRPFRTANKLRNRWCRVMPKLQLFAGYHANIVKQQPSGHNSEDLYDKADELYSQGTGHSFDFKEIWKVLKDTPKFRSANSGNEESCKRSKLREDGSYSTSTGSAPESQPRPMGIKAAKRKGKQAESSDTATTGSTGTGTALIDEGFKQMGFLAEDFRKYREDQARKIAHEERKHAYEVLTRDQRTMDPQTLKYHLRACKQIVEQYPEFADSPDE